MPHATTVYSTLPPVLHLLSVMINPSMTDFQGHVCSHMPKQRHYSNREFTAVAFFSFKQFLGPADYWWILSQTNLLTAKTLVPQQTFASPPKHFSMTAVQCVRFALLQKQVWQFTTFTLITQKLICRHEKNIYISIAFYRPGKKNSFYSSLVSWAEVDPESKLIRSFSLCRH